MTTWAVIVAAGSGDRLAADRPKAFARLGDRPLLAESLERLDRSEWVDGIVVACPEGWEEPAILLAEELGASKVAQAVTGGASRAESVRLGVNEVPPDAVALLVHDAARPLLAEDVISRVLEPLGEGWDGAVPALPVADTIKRVEGGDRSSRRSRATVSWRRRPRRPSWPTCCGPRSQETSTAHPTAHRSSRPPAAA